MNCERATESYMAHLAGEGNPGEEASMQAHLEGCAACRDTTEALAALWADLEGEVAPPPATLQVRVAALVEGYRQGLREAGGRARQPLWATGWLDRILSTPVWRLAPAALVLAAGVGLGMLWGHGTQRPEIDALRREVQSTRGLVALSMLQQRSPADRLQGIAWTARLGAPDPEVQDALLATLDSDPNVNVRLAVVEALAGWLDQPHIRDAFLASLDRQPSPLVQIALVDALEQSGEPRAHAAFQRLATNPQLDAAVRARAQWALRQLGS